MLVLCFTTGSFMHQYPINPNECVVAETSILLIGRIFDLNSPLLKIQSTLSKTNIFFLLSVDLKLPLSWVFSIDPPLSKYGFFGKTPYRDSVLFTANSRLKLAISQIQNEQIKTV